MTATKKSFYLVLIETSGNQQFIFSTNRLRENIGASELTYQAGTKWVLEAVAEANDQTSLQVWTDSKRLRKLLRDSEINPPIEDEKKPVEILTAASGKALLLVKDKETAKKIISEVTRKALFEAPGLDVAGVYEKIEDWTEKNSLAQAIKKVHKTFEKLRSRRPSPENRFLALPIIAKCSYSDFPAFDLEDLSQKQRKDGQKPKAISLASHVKRDKANEAKNRLTNLDSRLQPQIDKLLNSDEEHQGENRAWLAIIHADGNGLGQVFLNFEDYIGEDKSNPNYIKKYREFSLSLDECTEEAFKKALDVFTQKENQKKQNVAPIVPLIIGGDDLTVVCDGHYALEFTRTFLKEFEQQTQDSLGIKEVAEEAFGVGRLSACAGVAIVKPHFPFSVAYHLAEQLLKSAKIVKKNVTIKQNKNAPFPCSAIDFHILYNTTGIELNDIREKLKPEQNIQLYNRPYIVSENLDEADGQEWIQRHQWELLSERIKAFKSDILPRNQSHALRNALFIGKKVADSEVKLIEQRYNLTPFIEDKDSKSLFHYSEGIYSTSFLDALEAQNFLELDQSKNNQHKMEEIQ
ncbi:Cas10/Cmr2 second palm domain-containing protein [Spirulina subsalsa]|uniref:Cas10/Cmr2 second palm domain-containing protein n=1 Tax=Spirulina subsalsa TaxID=54311 RepID=UPI0002F225A0|nr:hypothetical protein [Spirulina subsalsa]